MSRMIPEKRLKRLEEEVKKIRPRDGMTEGEQIAAFGKLLKEMTDKELMEAILSPPVVDEALEKMTEQELINYCLNRNK